MPDEGVPAVERREAAKLQRDAPPPDVPLAVTAETQRAHEAFLAGSTRAPWPEVVARPAESPPWSPSTTCERSGARCTLHVPREPLGEPGPGPEAYVK